MSDMFCFQGREYAYLDHAYNGTRINERAVEVPIALYLLSKAKHALEVGAVLPHYLADWPRDAHEVIDLHERYPGVINADVLTYEAQGKYDLILCISTLDHLHNAAQVRGAVARMKSWLCEDGLLFVTLPHGQPSEVGGGPWLDQLVQSGALYMEICRMDKIDAEQHMWAERALTAAPLAYHGPSSFANTVYFLSYSQQGRGL